MNLQFKHMMSKCVVRVVKGESFEGDIPNDIVSHIYNTSTSCTVDCVAGSVEKDAFGAKNTITMKKITNNLFEAVIVPQNIENRTPLIELTNGRHCLPSGLLFEFPPRICSHYYRDSKHISRPGADRDIHRPGHQQLELTALPAVLFLRRFRP